MVGNVYAINSAAVTNRRVGPLFSGVRCIVVLCEFDG
jgi:hypothetical protein